MNKLMLTALAFVLLASICLVGQVRAGHGGDPHYPVHADRAARWFNANVPWHGGHYHTMWRQPVALVVPPTANMQSNFSWGVGRTRMTPINHQYGRAYPGPYAGGSRPLHPTPLWPSDTTQFGVYYVRGPW